MNILSGKKDDRENLNKIIFSLKDQGAQVIILGCTDLPLIISNNVVDIELFDTTKVLARAVVREVMK